MQEKSSLRHKAMVNMMFIRLYQVAAKFKEDSLESV